MSDFSNGGGDTSPHRGTMFTIAHLDQDLGGRRRGLLMFPISLLSENHTGDNLTASMQAIRKEGLVHPETQHLNLVIHVSDALYAFNYMMWDRDLSYVQARKKAEDAGKKWVDSHLTTIATQIESIPTIFYWSDWDTKHKKEYDQVLGELRGLHQKEDSGFRHAVEKDVDNFMKRDLWKRNEPDQTSVLPETENQRIRSLATEFVLHEAAGYTLIGRHIIAEYMKRLVVNAPDDALIISSRNGLQEDGVFRLYPGGGPLNAIKWLQTNKAQIPADLRGAEKVRSVEIKLSQSPISDANMLAAPESVRRSTTLGEILRRQNGNGNGNGNGKAANGNLQDPQLPDHPQPLRPDTLTPSPSGFVDGAVKL